MWHRQQDIRRNTQAFYREKKLVTNKLEKRTHQYDLGLGSENRSNTEVIFMYLCRVENQVYISETKAKQKIKELEIESHYNYTITEIIVTTGILMQRWANYDPQAKSG